MLTYLENLLNSLLGVVGQYALGIAETAPLEALVFTTGIAVIHCGYDLVIAVEKFISALQQYLKSFQ
jgi:hypothetical protein